MKNLNIAIVIVAYNRPLSLKRLLNSVSSAYYPEHIEPELIVSIDNSDSDICFEMAEGFDWKVGKKTIIHHSVNLGLKEHILKCGDLSVDYDFIILLEDDLYVSKYYFDYAVKVHSAYRGDKNIAGLSLYSYYYNETANKQFVPVDNGSDVFFLQLPSSWGQIWTSTQWSNFREWLRTEYSSEISENYLIPENVVGWPDTSWKKLFIFYMVVKDLYFVYPKLSLSTNFMDAGTHHIIVDTYLQVALQAHALDYNFIDTDDTDIFYDSFCELLPGKFKSCLKNIESFDFEVDIYGTKPLDKIKCRYILTSRLSLNSLYQYSLSLKPHELNILYNIRGDDVFFARISTISDAKYHASALQRNSYYYNIPEFLIKPGDADNSGGEKCTIRCYIINKLRLRRVVNMVKKVSYKVKRKLL